MNTAAQDIDRLLRERERSWAWLGRRLGINRYRAARLSRGEVPWRHHEALAACHELDMPFARLFRDGADVLPPGRERRGHWALPPRLRADDAPQAVAS